MAPRYIRTHLDLEQPKQLMLMKHGQVRMDGGALRGGSHKTFLTRTQYRKLKNARGPIIVRMSPLQHGLNLKYGGGFWDSLKRAGQYLRPLAQKGAHRLTHELGRQVDKYIPGAGDAARKAAYKLGRQYYDKYTGGGIRRKRRGPVRRKRRGPVRRKRRGPVRRTRRRRVRGGNLWDSIKSGFNEVWNPIVSGAKDLAPIVAELAPLAM